jgi:hypothetical protein
VLPLLEYDVPERSEATRRDFGRTLTELYEEGFLVPMREWATRNKVLFRIQNYGEPPAALANQLIGHGWPHSPPSAGTPGWPFYAAAVLSDKNPWWPVMPDLAAYLQRLSFLLRQGEPVTDVALYAPTEDAWSTFKPGTPRYLNLFQKIVDWIGPKVVPAILEAGHGFDLVDDGTLEEARGRGYKAVVLPGVRC